jgi:hypothetical protein
VLTPGEGAWDFQEQRRIFWGEPDLKAEQEGRFVLPSGRLATLTDQWGVTGDMPVGTGRPFTIETHPGFILQSDLKSFYGASPSNIPSVTIQFLPE